ncbi:MAG TPA: DUF2147 domain-containing protein [Treponema sp.]|nr:DUF2147 domain-containing protein [Treponema sp.]
MKKNLCIFTILLFCTGVVCAADPAEGYWISWDEKTDKATGGWYIHVNSDGMLYGEMLSAAGFTPETKAYGAKGKKPYKNFPVAGNPEDMPLVGTPWIFCMKKVKDGIWAGGNIVDPGDGNLYKCKITYHGASGAKPAWLEVLGEIGLGIGRSQRWRLSSEEEASSIW